MRQNRRAFLLELLATLIAVPAVAQESQAQSATKRRPVSDFPDLRTFQSGDFVWPKKKEAFVPRRLIEPQPSDDQKAWDAARESLLRADPVKSGLSPEIADKLRNMTYEEFEELYFAAPTKPADENVRSRNVTIPSQTIYVGHVGIVERGANGVPFVIEATVLEGFKGAVVRTSYEDWLKSHSGKQVWHGRVRALGVGVRNRVAQEAIKQLGRPYGFFNFNLNDDTSFYCSKLVWMSVWRATSGIAGTGPVAIDGDPNPHRPFFGWFSPKQLVNAKRVELLHKPGEY